ncbi:major facilitator superfamily domain-containing protein 2B-like, partial [Sinocyclocheilus rhinocerous]|uniref:major facilitator superfamily domain-containing protein 2B-like n=1 Tax=Sinocyclocheilus rhinocerous TaxID=307959 RepID=UPI0007BA9DE6
MDAGTAVASSEKPESSVAVSVPLAPAAMAKGEKAPVTSGDKLTMKQPEPAFTKVPPQTHLDQKLSVCSKLCFAIGGAPNQVAGSATAFFLQIYLLDIAQIFIDATFDRSRYVDAFAIFQYGGRLTMVGCTPFMVVSYFYLWFVPPFTNGRFIWYLGFYCLYQTLIT